MQRAAPTNLKYYCKKPNNYGWFPENIYRITTVNISYKKIWIKSSPCNFLPKSKNAKSCKKFNQDTWLIHLYKEKLNAELRICMS